MSSFILRQFGGFLATGDVTDPVTVALPDKDWEQKDVYPSTILKLDTGKYSSTQVTVYSNSTVDLPSSYDTANRLSFTLRTNQNLRVTVVSPVHADSVITVFVPADQYGFYSICERVTSIALDNVGDGEAAVEYFCFEYPDLDAAASWRDGFQTLGTVSS